MFPDDNPAIGAVGTTALARRGGAIAHMTFCKRASKIATRKAVPAAVSLDEVSPSTRSQKKLEAMDLLDSALIH